MINAAVETGRLLPLLRPDLASAKYPDLVAGITARYTEAGAMVVRTNTFNTAMMTAEKILTRDESMALTAKSAALALQGVRLAGGSPEVKICGSLGAMPRSDMSLDEISSAYAAQIHVLVNEGCDMISLETISDLSILDVVAPLVPDDVPLIATSCIRSAEEIRQIEQRVKTPDVVAGYNCLDIAAIASIAEQLSALPARFACFPSADESPELWAEKMYRLIESTYKKAGSSSPQLYIGGCCGTTPQHIKILTELINNSNLTT